MSNVSRKDLTEQCSDMTVEILNLAGKLRVVEKRINWQAERIAELKAKVDELRGHLESEGLI